MGKKMRVHKNHVFVTMCVTLLVMLGVAILSGAFIINTALDTFVRDCKNIDEISENFAEVIEKSMEEKGNTIQFYRDILLAANQWDYPSLLNQLKKFERQGEYTAVAYVDKDGKLISPNEQSFSEMDLNEVILEGHKPNQTLSIISTDKNVVYAAPFLRNRGMLLGIVAADLKTEFQKNDLAEDNSISDDTMIYILDESEQVVFYSGGKKDFCYEDVPKELFFERNDRHKQGEQTLRMLTALENLEGKKSTNIEEFRSLLESDTYFWYEKPIVADNHRQWKFLLAKAAAPSEETVRFMYQIFLLVGCIMIIYFFLMFFVLLSQALSNRKLTKMAYLDLVIEWPNWNKFILDTQKILKRQKKKKYAMVTIDVRKFRVISDIDGYQRDEEILRQIADVFRGCIRKNELFTRVAVDEFALLLRYINFSELEERIHQINYKLKNAVQVKGISFSVGIFHIADEKMAVQRMYNYSCMAKETIKRSTETYIGTFTEQLRQGLLKEKELENNMHLALKQKEFQVYLQPKYRADGNGVEGAEALVRWVSPTLGFISPGEFIPLFERNGFILELDRYMLEAVCKKQKDWQDAGKNLITISVNISRMHLVDPNLVDDIIQVIDNYGIPRECIELELTESAFFDDKEILVNTVNKIREAGLMVSMDDFGSGYSSLNSLKDLSLDVIKLDGEFFKTTSNAERSETVIKDTIGLAKHLNMKIVAEGIETKEQVDFLCGIGCDLIQGYYFAKPMTVTDFEKLMGWSN